MLSYMSSRNSSLILFLYINRFVANKPKLLSVQYILTALIILTRGTFW
nr:unnamed protein product [Callosobruchus analis]